MVGGTLTAFLAALHYWFPKITGQHVLGAAGGLGCARWCSPASSLTFMPQFLLGNAGMPRRYCDYPDAVPGAARRLDGRRVGARGRHAADARATSSLRSCAAGRAGPNPWRSQSFEWRTPSPPPQQNFESVPEWPDGPYDYEERSAS